MLGTHPVYILSGVISFLHTSLGKWRQFGDFVELELLQKLG